MKTLLCFFLMLVLCSCSFHPLPEEQDREPCFYPIYDPPTIVPGSNNCINPCQYVYEGVVNFEENRLEMNCLEFPLITEKMRWSIDSNTVRHITEGYIPIIRIQTPGFTHWCARDFSFMEIACLDIEVADLKIVHYDNTGEIQIRMGPGFWNCYSGSDFLFRLTATQPFL